MAKREFSSNFLPSLKKARVISGEMFRTSRMQRRSLGYAKAGMKRRGIPRAPSYPMRVYTFKRVGTEQVITYDGLSARVNGAVPPGISNGGLALSAGSSGNLTGSMKFGGAMTFSLASLGSGPASELTNLFDNYRIKQVILRIDYSANQSPGVLTQATTNVQFAGLPLLTYAPDFDDATIGSVTKAALLENGFVKQKRLVAGASTVYVKLNPRTLGTVVQGGTAQIAAQGARNQWLDSSNTQVEHYGFKFFVDDIATFGVNAGQYIWSITITPTYIIEAKSII